MNTSRFALNYGCRLLSLESSFGQLRLVGLTQFSTQPRHQKPPPSAFLLFYKSKLPEIKEMHKDSPSKVTQWSKTAGSMWKELDENSKKEYHELFQKQKQEYLSKMSEEDLAERKKFMSEKRHKNEKRRNKIEAKALNKPKRPPSAHGLYIQEKGLEMSQSDMKPIFRRLNSQWKDTTESEKEKYVKNAQQMKEKHEKELRAWEKEQFENNRKHLLRAATLKELEPDEKKPKAKKSAKKAAPKKDH